MSKTVDKIRKRARVDCPLLNGETLAITPLRHSQIAAMNAMQDESSKAWYVFGCVLIEDDGTPVFSQSEGESDADFAARVKSELDLTIPDQNSLWDAINRGIKTPSVETVAKNLPATATQS